MASRIVGTNHRTSKRDIISKGIERNANVGGKKRVYGGFTVLSSALKSDIKGDAVVEATILFPIMIMIFAALVLLAVYLPSRSVLQRATQYAATAIATENSDTWLFFDESSMSFYRETDKKRLKNVYADLFTESENVQSKGESIVIEIENRGINSKAGQLNVDSYIASRILYKEVVITASREYPMPVDLSFIGFPETITVTATSTAVVQNADELVRNIDMANGFAEFIIDRYGLSDIADAISTFGSRVSGILGW